MRLEGHERGWPVAGRVRMRKTPGHGAPVANLHVGGQADGIQHERQSLLDYLR